MATEKSREEDEGKMRIVKETAEYVKLTDYQLRLLDILSNSPRELTTREIINVYNALYEPREYYLIWTSLKRMRNNNLVACRDEFFKRYYVTPEGMMILEQRRGRLYGW